MKNSFFILIGLLVFTSCAIPDSERMERELSVLNDSGSDVAILLFDINGNMAGSYVLANQEQTPFEKIDSSSEAILTSPESSIPSAALFGAFSASIIFSNEKLSMFNFSFVNRENSQFSNPVLRNIFRNGNYESLVGDQFLYTITQVDFEAATPCDGYCE